MSNLSPPKDSSTSDSSSAAGAAGPSRVVVITGVSRGLGLILARRLAALGHRIAGCARSAPQLRELSRELGEPHLFDRVDVTDAAAVETWAGQVIDRLGTPDLLLNNAALINRRAPLWQVPAEEFSRVIDVNIKGVTHVVRAFVPAMIERGHGVIVNFSSGWGHSTAPEVAPYCATKFAIEGLTGALAQELPPGLAAVPLSPGIIHTEMLDEAFGAGASAHWGPEEWADVAVPFLLALGPGDNGVSQRIPGS